MEGYNYILNKNTGTMHKKGGCYCADVYKGVAEYFKIKDSAISYGTRYIKLCKNCFKK